LRVENLAVVVAERKVLSAEFFLPMMTRIFYVNSKFS
jgi:hypothetical protein